MPKKKTKRRIAEKETVAVLRDEVSRMASALLSTLAQLKAAFLDYVEESDKDPTLRKVAAHVAHVQLRKVATSFSTLGLSKFAQRILIERDSIEIGGMLVLLDDAISLVAARFPKATVQPAPGYQSLARARASLLVRTICDENGARIFHDGDADALAKKSPQALDRLWDASVQLNNLLPQRKPAGDAKNEKPREHPPSRITKSEANVRARAFLQENPTATVRQLAIGVGCAIGLVPKLTAWQAVNEERKKGRAPKSPGVVSFTPKLESSVGAEDATLADLIADHDVDQSVDDGIRTRRKIRRKL